MNQHLPPLKQRQGEEREREREREKKIETKENEKTERVDGKSRDSDEKRGTWEDVTDTWG